MTDTVNLEFANPEHFDRIMLIHDTVMGGRSDGDVKQVRSAVAVKFYGNLSLDNNGGFASVEFTLPKQLTAKHFNQVMLRALADNRTYQLRLKTPYIPQGVAYVAEFKSESELRDYKFSVADFVGRYRGRKVINLPVLNFADVRQVSVMLADKTAGPFNIELHTLRFATGSSTD